VVGCLVGIDDADLLPERIEGERHRELRADRIAVGPRVRGQQEALPLPDLVPDVAARGSHLELRRVIHHRGAC
jgi:hypothetical protein